MNNFGVVELATAKKASAPGWAYVPDVAPQTSNLQPANRKRARNTGQGPSIGDLSARQEARRRKEVEALEKDGGRDNTISVPAKAGRAQRKTTPNVRRILQSQKTFGNHLDDFLALQQSESHAANIAANNKRAGTTKPTNTNTTTTPTTPILQITTSSNPLTHSGDNNPLLASRIPAPPTDTEIHKLLAHPPLTYLEARGTYDADARPARVFCEVCGYWGRVRCVKCGTRVCALECLETHREECVTRYGH